MFSIEVMDSGALKWSNHVSPINYSTEEYVNSVFKVIGVNTLLRVDNNFYFVYTKSRINSNIDFPNVGITDLIRTFQYGRGARMHNIIGDAVIVRAVPDGFGNFKPEFMTKDELNHIMAYLMQNRIY